MDNRTIKKIDKIETKVDLLEVSVNKLGISVDGMAEEVLKHGSSLDYIEENMATKDDMNRVLTAVDKVLKEVLDVRVEQVAHTGSHMRVDETLAGHDKRIKKLESPSAVAYQIK